MPDPCSDLPSNWYEDVRQSSSYPEVDTSAQFAAAEGSDQMWAYLANDTGIARYLNFYANPLWSYRHWFPLDYAEDDPVVHATEWRVQGSRANPTDYWLPLRQQWLNHPALPSGEQRKTRSDLAAVPLLQGPYSADSLFFWGISRFQVENVTPLADYEYTSASSSLWSGTSCTLTHGANITVNPSALNCQVDLDLGSFTVEPYMYPHACNQFTVSWNPTNVASVTIYLITTEGDTIQLATTTGTHSRPVGSESKYAGSWGQDFGMGIATDIGTDSLPAGISSTVMASDERVSAFLLINTRTAAKLRFDITVSDHTVNMTLDYPTIVVASGNATVMQEGGLFTDILFPSGPGLRFGHHDWWDTGGAVVRTSPTVRPVGEKPTVLDWLCWRRTVLEGLDRTSGLDAAIAALYDSTEGQTRQKITSDTYSLILSGTAAGRALLVNSISECPPLDCFPLRERGASLAFSASYVQEAFDLAQEKRYIVAGGGYIHQFQPTPSEQWTAVSSIAPAGWYITEHQHEVDNTEDDTFLLMSDATEIAKASPFHCYFGTRDIQNNTAAYTCLMRDYTERAFFFFRDATGNLCVHAYDDLDSAYITYKVDTGSTDCTHPDYHLFGDLMSGTHLRTNTAVVAHSLYHGITDTEGRSWTIVTVDNAITYTALTSANFIDRLVVLGYHVDAGAGDPNNTNWYCQVGLLQQDGTYVWSNPVEITTLSSPTASGDLRANDDGFLEFAYLDTGGLPHIARCYALDKDGVGAWA